MLGLWLPADLAPAPTVTEADGEVAVVAAAGQAGYVVGVKVVRPWGAPLDYGR